MGKFAGPLCGSIAAASFLGAVAALSAEPAPQMASARGATEVEAVMQNGVLTVIDVADPDHRVVTKVDIGAKAPK